MSYVDRRWSAIAVAGLTALIASISVSAASASDPSCSGSGTSIDQTVEADGGCDDPPESPSNDTGNPTPVRDAVECTDELRSDPSAWFRAYDPDWANVDAYQESGLLMSEREEGQVVAILRDCAGNDRGSPFWADPPPEGQPGGFDRLLDARDRALASLELPTPDPQLVPDGRVITGMPAWLWVDHDWADLEATDAIPGVTVTVYAEPQELTWTTPEGDRICDGPGIPWTPTAWDDYQAMPLDSRGQGDPACTFTFTHASGEQPYATTVTVTWTVGWSINGGARMDLDPLELTTELPVTVGEVRAVRTR